CTGSRSISWLISPAPSVTPNKPFSFLESYVDLSVARRASAFGACLGSDRAEHIRASLMRLKTGSDVLHTPNFQPAHSKAKRAGRCLNLKHIQQGDRIAGIGQNR